MGFSVYYNEVYFLGQDNLSMSRLHRQAGMPKNRKFPKILVKLTEKYSTITPLFNQPGTEPYAIRTSSTKRAL